MLYHKLFYGEPGEEPRGATTRLCVVLDDRPYYIRIHKTGTSTEYEVDMSLLGCNARVLWHEIYTTIIDAIRTTKNSVVVCKEFQEIHVELHDIFYSYMQEDKVVFHIYTSSISFIKDPIRDACTRELGRAPRQRQNHIVMCQRIVAVMDGVFYGKSTRKKAVENPYLVLREVLYDVLVYHVDVCDVVWYILCHLMPRATAQVQTQMMHETIMFFKYYNNYFRPIHHLERICFRLWGTLGREETLRASLIFNINRRNLPRICEKERHNDTHS